MAFNPQHRQPGVAAAWRSYQSLMGPTGEREELAFWAGASVLFYGLLQSLDQGDEPTDVDLAGMDRLHAEIERFCETFDRRARAVDVLTGRRSQ